jgi:hypothetical protein
MTMTATKNWTVELLITDNDRQTTAEARLTIDELEGLVGHGTARRNPVDSNVPLIGDELASARALSNLSHLLLETAVQKLEGP